MSYPDPNDKDFNRRITKKYNKYNIPNKKESLRQICFPKKYKLQLPQQFLAKYINPNSPYKGVLVFHRIGAGKTCTAVNIGEQWKHKRKIVTILPASLIGSFRSELRSLCAGNAYITKKDREKLKELKPSSKEYKKIIKESNEKIDKYYNIMSYNKFIEYAENGEISLKKSVLIIDEVQNMVSEEGKYYNILYNTIHESPNDLRIVLLSATPMFDKPIEVALTMNLLKLPFELPTGKEFEKMFLKLKKSKDGEVCCSAKNLKIFKERIKGYVSYFRGAPEHVFPSSTIKYVKCEMSNFQYNSYKTVLKNENKSSKFKKIQDISDLPNNFFIGTRMISNVVFPNKKINKEGFKSFKGKHLTLEYLDRYSIKFYKILKSIKRSSGTVFIYSNFKEFGGIYSFIKVLEGNGYMSYIKHGEGRKRFAVWSSDEKLHIKDEIKEIFNRKSNANGSKLKIILGSPAIKEGVTLLRVQQVHILEPYWNQSRVEQVIGRAIRYCSHKDVPEEKRSVRVYIYIATHPKAKITVDEYIHEMSMRKNKLIKEFERALKEVAIDCSLFKNANSSKNSKIICDV